MAYDVETVVIGAGVIGLAIAAELSNKGHEVLILEKRATWGSETSARNSEVIHAGIYYPKDSLKAKLCVRGKALLYDYCETHSIPHKRIGKIIVATSNEQANTLHAIKAKAIANGVNDLQSLNQKQITELEPAIVANAGLLSSSTGIIDSHAFMLSLLGKCEFYGASLAYNTEVGSIYKKDDGFKLSVRQDESTQLTCKHLINACGHGSIPIANSIEDLNNKHVPKARYAKGNYFRLKGATPVSRLIYPVPVDGGLGVHITLNMAGLCRFGPDVQWQDSLNVDVEPERADVFYAAVREYWPALEDGALLPDYAGVRPKIEINGEPCNDFLIQASDVHGVHNLVNLFGIESPGLTSSLAIAEHVAFLLQR